MPDLSRLLRLFGRIASRAYDFAPLRSAGSRGEAYSLATKKPLHLFNGNVLRAKVVEVIIEKAECGYFIETGTSHAATAIGARRYFNLPVWSCENNRKDYLISRFVTFGITGISLFNIYSRGFLLRVIADMKRQRVTPFVYLDAHEGELDGESFPLVDEVELILELDSFVVMIDDLRVPGVDEFRWGSYGGNAVEIKLIRDLLMAGGIGSCYFPSYSAREETGYTSGYCIFWRSTALDEAVKTSSFPFELLQAFSICQGDY